MTDIKVYVVRIGTKLFYVDWDFEKERYITTKFFSEAWKTDNPDEANTVADEIGGMVALFQVKELEN